MKLIITALLILLFSNYTFSQASVDPYCDSLKQIRKCFKSLVLANDSLYLDKLTESLSEIVGKDRDSSNRKNFDTLYTHLDNYSTKLEKIKTVDSTKCYVLHINENFRYEFANYLLAIKLLKDEIEKVKKARYAMLPIINYKNAYFNLLRSKSQLEVALGQYISLIDGKIAAKELANSMKLATDTIGMVNDVSGGMDSAVTIMKVGLDSTFKPYKDLSAKSMKNILKSHTGKVESASNVILNDARRNNWWRAAIGGLAGGLIAGLIIGLIN